MERPSRGMKVAIDTSVFSSPSGVGHYARAMTSALQRRKDVTVIPVAPRGKIPFLSRHLGVPLEAWARGAKLLYGPGGHTPLGWCGKSIVTVHDVAIYEHPEWFDGLGSQAFSTRVLVPRSLERATKIIAISEATKQGIARVFPGCEKKTVVISPGVEVPEDVQPFSAETIARFGLTEDMILFVGTLEPRKNLVNAIKGFAAFLRSHPERVATTRFILAGGRGWGAEAVEAAIKDLNAQFASVVPTGVVRHVGYVSAEEKWALYTHARALLFVSWDEGFGLPVIEAQAIGCPVITTDRGALPEAAGDAALYVQPDNPESIGFAIAQCILMPDAVALLVEEGRARVKQFTWDRAAEKIAHVFNEMV